MVARNRGLRSLSILLLAVVVNGSILAIVFRVLPPSAANGDKPGFRSATSTRSASPSLETRRAAARDRSQSSARSRNHQPVKNAASGAGAGADSDSEHGVEIIAAETETQADGSPGLGARQDGSAVSPESKQSGAGRESARDAGEGLTPGGHFQAAALAAYESRRAEARDRAGDQKQLASWCDAHGLWDQARTHWESVIRFDPRDETARRRLGYRSRPGESAVDARLAEEVLQKKAREYWSHELTIAHKQIDAQNGRGAAKKAFDAATRVESVTDPLAVPTLWSVFSGHHKHHRLLAGVLDHIKTRPASQMLAAIAVYSFDEKARFVATQALTSRNPDEFIDKLVPLLNHRLQYQVQEIADASGGRARVLFIEGQQANYQLLYPSPVQQEAASCFGSFYMPGITSRQEAQQYNAAQSRLARALTDQQIASDKAAVDEINRSIDGLNERVVQVLTQASGVSNGPEPETWRRWLAERQGQTYQPLNSVSRPTLAQVVSPLYSPTFLAVAPAPS